MKSDEFVILKDGRVGIPLKSEHHLHAAGVTGFVLAGGHSSRMGTDKALALFREMPLIQIALDTLAQAGLPAQIAGSRSPLASFAPEIPDSFPESGPLGGIHATMTASNSEWSIFLPVDLPLLPALLLQCLLQRAQLTGSPITAVRRNGRLEPFPVVLHRTTLPAVEARLKANQSACHAAWQSIPVELGSFLDSPAIEYLVQSGQCSHPEGFPAAFWFQSANTPDDLALFNAISSKLRA